MAFAGPRASMLQPGRARPERGALRLHLGVQQQRLGLRRAHRQHALLQHRPRGARCSSAGSCRSSSCSRWPARSPSRSGARDRRHPADPPTHCSSACSPASLVIVAASPSSRRWRWVRSRKGSTDGHRHRRGTASGPGRSTRPSSSAPSRRPCASSTRAPCVRSPVMFVVEVGAVLTTRPRDRATPSALRLVDHGLALAHRALREPRRGGRRGPRQGAGRHPAQDPHGDHRPTAAPRDGRERAGRRRRELRHRRPRRRRGRRHVSPATATSSRASRRVDESAITGESAPVIRESGGDRSRRHRRHHGALRPDRRARSRRSRARPSSTG